MDTSIATLFVLFVLTNNGANAVIRYMVEKRFQDADYNDYPFVTDTIQKQEYEPEDKEFKLTTKICERKRGIMDTKGVTVADIQFQLEGEKGPKTLITFLLKELAGNQFERHGFKNVDPLSSTLRFLVVSQEKLEFIISKSIEYGDDVLNLYTITNFAGGKEKKVDTKEVEKSEVKDREVITSMSLSK